eukprot:UN14478
MKYLIPSVTSILLSVTRAMTIEVATEIYCEFQDDI